MTGNDLYQWLDAIAPFGTQETYDNSGFLLGNLTAAVHKVFFTVDITLAAVKEAERIHAEMIVAHHPLMFSPIHQIRYDLGEGAVIRALAVSGINVIAAHTNLDQCTGGIADSLADTLSLQKITMSPSDPYLRTGSLAAPCTAKELLAFLNTRLSTETILHGSPDAVIHTVAAAPGAGGECYPNAEADAFITGELKHHELIDACARGLTVFESGHYPTEFPGIAALYQRFSAAVSDHGWPVETALYTQPPYPCIAHR